MKALKAPEKLIREMREARPISETISPERAAADRRDLAELLSEVRMDLENANHLVYRGNAARGFWDRPVELGTALMLVTSELAEALEAERHGDPGSEKIPGYSHVEEELADAVIRLMDLAGGRGYDLWGAVEAKLAYNATRAFKHGKAF